jgi:hypothetical protein
MRCAIQFHPKLALRTMMKRRSALFGFLLLALLCGAQKLKSIRFDDNSDWWSILKDDSVPGPEVKPGKQPLPGTNFRLAGLKLGSDFEQISSRLGPARVVDRGDASTGRHQLCYTSHDSKGKKSYLIFEVGEVNYAMYLFQGAADWKGNELCADPKISLRGLHTDSGLKLGLSPTQVEAILGKPELIQPGRWLYVREFKRKTTPQEFAQMRKDYPRELGNISAHQMFDYYDVQMYVEVRFVYSKLTYLVISQSETD